ncbi:MAG: flagellar biosynthetic protein FliR [Pirellulaceae bacterium]
MEWIVSLYRHELIVFAMVLARVGGMIAAAPLGAARSWSVPFRLTAAVALALLLTPICSQSFEPTELPYDPPQFLLAAASELALGVVFGLAIAMLMAGAKLAGQIVANLLGLSMGDAESPADSPAFVRLFDFTATAVFLAVGGHRQVVAALLDAFQWVPPGAARPSIAWLDGLLGIATHSIGLGLRISAPLVVSVLLAHIALGFVARTIPQLKSMGMSFNVNSLVALASLSLSLGTVVWLMQDQLETVLVTLQTTLVAELN